MNKIALVDIGKEFKSPFGVTSTTSNLGDLTNLFLNIAIVVAGVIIVFLFIFGGIGIIAGAGQDNPESTAKGKKALTAAIAGFLIIFAAYWIIRVIELVVGVNFVTRPGV